MEIVAIKDLKVHQDDRGWLFEAIHGHEVTSFGQVYVVVNPARGTVRAFHKHHKLFDYFVLVAGVAKFCFVDDREDKIAGGINLNYKVVRAAMTTTISGPVENRRPGPGRIFEVTVSGERPKLISVPPGIFHGWMSLTDNAVLMSIGSEVYDARNPDEVRVKPDYFDQEFGRDPWHVEGR